jgi:hypothetical protein
LGQAENAQNITRWKLTQETRNKLLKSVERYFEHFLPGPTSEASFPRFADATAASSSAHSSRAASAIASAASE